MATSYDVIFKRFLSEIKDYEIAMMEPEVIEEDLLLIFNSSLPFFFGCKKNLEDKDDELKQFNIDLNQDEINIIVSLMKRQWFKREIFNTDLTQQKFAENDFEFKSQANHLNALCKAKVDILDKEIKKMISNYSRRTNGEYFNYSRLVGK